MVNKQIKVRKEIKKKVSKAVSKHFFFIHFRRNQWWTTFKARMRGCSKCRILLNEQNKMYDFKCYFTEKS